MSQEMCANCRHAESGADMGYCSIYHCHNPINTTVFRRGLLVEWSDCCDNFEARSECQKTVNE